MLLKHSTELIGKKMPEEKINLIQKMQESGVLYYVFMLFVSVWAGSVRYLGSLKGEKIKWKDLLLDVFISGFVGLITVLTCQYLKLGLELTGAVTGVMAHQGTRSLYFITAILKNSPAGVFVEKRKGR